MYGTSLLKLAHEINPDADQQQHRTPADQKAHQQGLLFTRLDVEFDAGVAEAFAVVTVG